MMDRELWLEGHGEHGDEAAAMFEPEVVDVMRRALDASWSALAFAHFEDETEVRATRERLAKRILEVAAEGERRVPVLSGRALGALEPRRAAGSANGARGATSWRFSRYVS